MAKAIPTETAHETVERCGRKIKRRVCASGPAELGRGGCHRNHSSDFKPDSDYARECLENERAKLMRQLDAKVPELREKLKRLDGFWRDSSPLGGRPRTQSNEGSHFRRSRDVRRMSPTPTLRPINALRLQHCASLKPFRPRGRC